MPFDWRRRRRAKDETAKTNHQQSSAACFRGLVLRAVGLQSRPTSRTALNPSNPPKRPLRLCVSAFTWGVSHWNP
jgi:hypothetical protein